jgi:uncharacterized protein (DUF983 family)
MKVCTTCGAEKPHDEFYKWQRKCKACVLADRKPYYVANKDRMNAATKKWKEANPDRVRSTARRKKYGTDGQELWEAQRGMCGICGKDLSAERIRDACSTTATRQVAHVVGCVAAAIRHWVYCATHRKESVLPLNIYRVIRSLDVRISWTS